MMTIQNRYGGGGYWLSDEDYRQILSEKSAYREALEEIALYGNVVSPTGSMVRSIVSIARAALDRKPGEPVGRDEIRNILYKRLTMEGDSMDEVADHFLKNFRVERR